jgi:hypothetical protein
LIAEVERRFRRAMNVRRDPKDSGREIANLTDAIASGVLKSSPCPR